MANIFNDLKICDKIPENIKICIKLFHVFNDVNRNKNIIFATNEHKVYGLGSNQLGCLGCGHDREVNEFTEIKKLSNLEISDLFASKDYCLAKTDENGLFVWGSNKFGQSGRGYNSNELFQPFQCDCSNTEMIDDIKCGLYHTLILLANGWLYGWGNNEWNQLDSIDSQMFCKPKRLTIIADEFRFKYIYCFGLSSFAVTTNGELFSWGSNTNGLLGHGMSGGQCLPQRVNLVDVHKICSNKKNTYFLTNEGLIYFCGKYVKNKNNKQQNSPKIMKKINDSDIVIKDLPQITRGFTKNLICVDSKNTFYTLNGNSFDKLNENYKSIIDLYAKRFQITPQTIHISSERAEQYFIIQNGIEVYPCDEQSGRKGQKLNESVEYKLESNVNKDNEMTQKLLKKIRKLSKDLKNETINNKCLSKSLLEAKEEIKELKLQMKNSCSEGYKEVIRKPTKKIYK